MVLALTIILSSALVGLGEIDFSGLFAVKAEAVNKDCLEDMPIVEFGQYDGNQGDSTIFNLNRNGLTQCNDGKTFYRNGNIGLNGEIFENGFEAWIARWNYTNEISWAYAIFDIGGNYNKLTGKTSLIKSYNTTNFDTTIYFYDGETLLASYTLTDTDYEKDIEVDVTGVKELKLYVRDNVAVSGGTSFAIYDLFFDKSVNESDLTFTLNGNRTSYSVSDCDISAFGEIIIPSTYNGLPVTGIGYKAFCGCESITSVTIPSSITNIDYYVFDDCTSLTSINVGENNIKYSSVDGVLFNKDKTVIVKYPAGKADTEYTILNSVTSIGDGAFSNCTGLVTVKISDSVTNIGYRAFYNCDSFVSVVIPDSVTNIDYGAFRDCTSLTFVKIGNSVTRIGVSAFQNCASLTSVTIPVSVTSICAEAFEKCSSLKQVYYGGSNSDWNNIDIDENGNDSLLSSEILFNYKYYVPNFPSFEEKFADDLANNHADITNQLLPCQALIEAGGMPSLYWNTFLQSVNAVLEMDIFVNEKHFYEAILLDLISDTYTSVDYGEELLKSTLDMTSLLGDYLIGKGVEISKVKFDSAGLNTMWSAMQEYMFATDVEITKDVFMAVADGCENASECLDKISIYIIAQQKGQNLVYALRQMKTQSDYGPLTQCIDEMINVFDLTSIELAQKVAKAEGINKSLDVLQSTTLGAIKNLIPVEQVKAVANIADYGANLVFPTSNSSDQMYRIYALYHIESVVKSAYDSAVSQYKFSQSFNNAQTLVSCYDMFVRIYDHEIGESKALAELLYKNGVLNYVKNFFSGNDYEDYYYALDWIDSYNACLDSIKEVRIDSYNEWGLSVGKLQRVCLVSVFDGKIMGYNEYFPETGDSFELPEFDVLSKGSYNGISYTRFKPQFKFEGWYYDEECTQSCTGTSFVSNGPAVRYAKFSTKNGKTITVNNDVDVRVVFNNRLNGIVINYSEQYLVIENNEVIYDSGDLNVSVINGCYSIFIPEKYNCIVTMQPRNNMEFNYTISNVKNGVEDSRYNNVDVEVAQGDVIQCEVLGSNDLIVEDATLYVSSSLHEGKIIPQKIEKEYLQQEVINISKEGNGNVSSGFKATKGDFITVVAQPAEGEKLVGWYLIENGERVKVSEETVYSFFVEKSQNLVAVFSCQHNETVLYNYVKNSCVDSGYSGDVVCWCCQTLVNKGKKIAPAGHNVSNWITDKNATASAAGSKHKECTVCGEVLEKATIPQLKCATPNLTKIENASNGIKITWGKVTGAQSYNVYRKTYSNGKWSGWSRIKYGVTGTSYTDTTAKSGVTYTYTVRAKNAAGLSSYNTTGLKYKFLSTPKLTSISNGSGKVTVKWNKVTGAKGYYVYRQTYSNGKWSGWKKVATTSNNYYNDTKVSSGNYYKYTVRAYNGNYISYYNTTGLKTKYLAVAPLKSAVSQSAGVKVTWGKVTGAKGYNIYRQTYSNGKWSGWSKIKTVSSGSTVSYTDKSAKKGVTYKYTVRATSDSYIGYYNTKGLQVKDKY